MQIVEMKSAAVYEKWWRRYNEYADGRSSSTNDVKTFMNWLLHYETKARNLLLQQLLVPVLA